jgi:hypothetical protein
MFEQQIHDAGKENMALKFDGKFVDILCSDPGCPR